jgi:hypothetical protein
MMVEKRRLLILSCSRRKQADEGLLPAIRRYDGPCFRVLRRYLKEKQSSDSAPDILILSAEHGLLSAQAEIAMYERRLTQQRVTELAAETQGRLQQYLQDNQPYAELLVCMGKDYQRILGGYVSYVPTETKVQIADGSIGAMQSMLYDWLHGKPPPALKSASTTRSRFGDVAQQLSREEVLQKAQQGLSSVSGKQASSYRSWYVEICGQRMAPKWLVSLVTGLPVSQFHTQMANQFLAQLGIPILRNNGENIQEVS